MTYRITDGINFLSLDGDGVPRWTRKESATLFPTRQEAQAARKVARTYTILNTMMAIVRAK